MAVDDTTVYGPRSMSCFSPTPPDFEELAKNEGKKQREWEKGPYCILFQAKKIFF